MSKGAGRARRAGRPGGPPMSADGGDENILIFNTNLDYISEGQQTGRNPIMRRREGSSSEADGRAISGRCDDSRDPLGVWGGGGRSRNSQSFFSTPFSFFYILLSKSLLFLFKIGPVG